MFLEVVQLIKNNPLEETRVFRQNYFECVVSLDHLNLTLKVLTDFFGPPIKDADAKPTDESNRFSALDGGVRQGQTLYLKLSEDTFFCALIWPWSDGIHTTIKFAKRSLSDLMPPPPQSFWEKIQGLFQA
jgi:hypothetical protein